jgi:hypothetical protein
MHVSPREVKWQGAPRHTTAYRYALTQLTNPVDMSPFMPDMSHIGSATMLRCTCKTAARQSKGDADMASYNETFELSVEDMDLIESALRKAKADLSVRALPEAAQHDKTADSLPQADDTLRHIHDLLGRLHNQKVFFRPRGRAYIGG